MPGGCSSLTCTEEQPAHGAVGCQTGSGQLESNQFYRYGQSRHLSLANTPLIPAAMARTHLAQVAQHLVAVLEELQVVLAKVELLRGGAAVARKGVRRETSD